MIYLDEILQGVKTVGITGHIRPDGDCVGSTLGVYNYICDNMPQVDVDICLQPINDKFLFLRNSDKIKEKADGNKLYDLLKYIIYASFYVIVIYLSYATVQHLTGLRISGNALRKPGKQLYSTTI